MYKSMNYRKRGRNRNKYYIILIIELLVIMNGLINRVVADSDSSRYVATPIGRDSYNGYSNKVEIEHFDEHYFKVEIALNYNKTTVMLNFSVRDDDDGYWGLGLYGDFYFYDKIEFYNLDVSDGREDSDLDYYTAPVFVRSGASANEESFKGWWHLYEITGNGFKAMYCINATYYKLKNGSRITFIVNYVDYYGYFPEYTGCWYWLECYLIEESSYCKELGEEGGLEWVAMVVIVSGAVAVAVGVGVIGWKIAKGRIGGGDGVGESERDIVKEKYMS